MTSSPQADEAFLIWSRNFVALVIANAATWNIPQSEAAALQTLLADYDAKLDAAKAGNRGKADVAEKNAAKEALMHKERMVTKLYIAWNLAVSDAQREVIGATVHDGVRTSIPAPKTRPEFSFKVADIMRIQIDFRDQGSASRAIPYGCNGAVFCYTAADAPVSDYKLLVNSALLTHSPWTLNLPPEAEGKTLSGAMMWQNEKGEKGPWSEILSVIIP
ncbi:MAG: hypothetical protein LBD58_08685 [Treponema sp.]|jgi:hypothetical protein|nr:hypothetical protein [Treponema sp.]